MGKSGTGFGGKNSSGTNSFGKSGNSFGKTSGLSKTPNTAKLGSSITTPKLTGLTSPKLSTSPGKNYSSLGSTSNNKPSVSLGIIWIPTKKHNKKKDIVYNRRNYDYGKERSPSMYKFMSGDSHDHDFHTKKDEDSHLLVPASGVEKIKSPLPAIATAEVATATVDIPTANTEEKQELIKHDKDETKDASGDTNDNENEKDKKYSDYLENNTDNKSPEHKWEKDLGDKDKVDSVYLRPPPPHKARSSASTPDEEDCGIKCLYYTLQCCDCVLM